MKKYKEQYLILMLLILSALSYSQKAYNDSLSRYIDIAEQNNPELKGKFNEYKASLEKVNIAGTLPDPNITLGVFLQSMELVEGNQVADIKLMQMFPWFGSLKASRNEALQMSRSKYEEMRDVKYRLSYDIKSQYYRLYQLEQSIKLSQKNIEILNTIKQLALVKFKTADGSEESGVRSQKPEVGSQNKSAASMQSANSNLQTSMGNQQGAGSSMQGDDEMGGDNGKGGLAEILRIQLEINEIENNIILFKNQEKAMIARFNSYLNRIPTYAVQVSDTINADTTFDPGIKIDSIKKNNPMLGMINADKEAYEAKIQMSKYMKYPMLGLGLDYSVINKRADVMSGMNGKDMIMPMITATLPIYRKKYNAQIKEATLQKTASENKYDAAVNSLQADYIEALQEYINAKQKLKFNKVQTSITQITFNLLINNFSTSKSDMTEILRVQQQLLDYKLRSIEAIVEINNAIAMLKQLTSNN